MEVIYKATIQDDTYTIEKHYNEILVTNENNDIIQQIPLESTDNIFNKEQISIEPKSLSYCIPDTPWKATHNKGYTSRSIVIADISIVIGIVAYISGLPEFESLVFLLHRGLLEKLPQMFIITMKNKIDFLMDGWKKDNLL